MEILNKLDNCLDNYINILISNYDQCSLSTERVICNHIMNSIVLNKKQVDKIKNANIYPYMTYILNSQFVDDDVLAKDFVKLFDFYSLEELNNIYEWLAHNVVRFINFSIDYDKVFPKYIQLVNMNEYNIYNVNLTSILSKNNIYKKWNLLLFIVTWYNMPKYWKLRFNDNLYYTILYLAENYVEFSNINITNELEQLNINISLKEVLIQSMYMMLRVYYNDNHETYEYYVNSLRHFLIIQDLITKDMIQSFIGLCHLS